MVDESRGVLAHVLDIPSRDTSNCTMENEYGIGWWHFRFYHQKRAFGGCIRICREMGWSGTFMRACAMPRDVASYVTSIQA